MGVMTDVATRLHTAEALRPIVFSQREAEKETKGCDRLQPMSQRVILVASTTTGTSIPKKPPPTIHRFLNARNVTSPQTNFVQTYAGNNNYFPASF